MSYLIRKINRAKWEKSGMILPEISADAITSCLRTANDELSFWRVEKLEQELINKVIVAISTSGDRIDTIDIAIIDESNILGHIDINPTKGRTPFGKMADNHCDLINLNFFKLGFLADLINQEVKANKSIRISKSKLLDLIKLFISTQELSIEDMHSNIRSGLKI